MTFDNIFVRRVAPSEVERIKTIQENNKESVYHEWLWKHYNKHDLWLTDVIEEIKDGKRIALAAWGSYYVNRDYDEKESCFLASIILKQPQFIDYKLGELKNLIVDERQIRNIIIKDNKVGLDNFRANENYISSAVNEVVIKIWTRIIERVETYCKRRSFKELFIEVPAENVTLINSFLNNQFIVKDSKPSQYIPGKSLYILSKTIPTYYSEDPFCLEEIAKWIVSTYYCCIPADEPYKNLETGLFEKCLSYITDYITYNNFTKPPDVDFSSSAKPPDVDFSSSSIINLHGRIYVFKNYDIDEFDSVDNLQRYINDIGQVLDMFSKEPHINIMLSYLECEHLRVECTRRGVAYFSREKNRAIFGKESLASTIPFDRTELAGIIFVEDETFRAKIVRYSDKPFVYILNGSTGRYADERWSEFNNLPNITSKDCELNENSDLRKNIALFFSPFVDEKDTGVIWGFSVIEGVRYGKKALNFNYNFMNHDHYDNIESQDFDRLIKYNESGPVVSFLLSPPCLLQDQSLVEVKDICGPVTKPSIRKYLDDLSVSNIYINNNMKTRFLRLVNEKIKLCQHSEKSDVEIEMEEANVRKSIFQSFRLALEALKTLPPGQLILGPLLRLYDEEKHDELARKVDALYLEIGKIKEENIASIISDGSVDELEVKAIVEMLNKIIYNIQEADDQTSYEGDIRKLLSESILPIPDHLLIDELSRMYCATYDFDGFNNALMRGNFKLSSTPNCETAINLFVKQLHSGKEINSIQLCFERFKQNSPNSKIILLCNEYFESLTEM